MYDLKDKHNRKALIEASIIMILLIILMFLSGMTYLDPPPETGIAVNFGTSDVGKGLVQPQHNTPPKPVQQEQPKQEEQVTKPEIKDDVLTQDTEDAPVIKDKPQKPKPKPTPKPVKPKPKPKPKPDSNITDILNNVNNAPGESTNNSSGEGNDNQAGDKGDVNGDPNASGYYGTGGNGGAGGTGNYRLGNRKAVSKPKPHFSCNENGRIVVKIKVNRNGTVIYAKGGVKMTSGGKTIRSTNAVPCLIQAAEQAAKNTKWNKDSKAPTQQYGYIIYNFKVTE